MPIIKSAQKRMRQEVVRRARNRSLKIELRNRSKALSEAIKSKDSKKVAEAHNALVSVLDTAVKKNILHKNNVARKKSAAAKAIKEAGVKLTAGTKKASPTAKKTTAKKTAAKKPAAKKATTKKAPTKKTAPKK